MLSTKAKPEISANARETSDRDDCFSNLTIMRRSLTLSLLICMGVLCRTPDLEAFTDSVDNLWPGPVSLLLDDVGRANEQTALGPLFGHYEVQGEREVTTIRPLWVQIEKPQLNAQSTHILYPFLNFYSTEGASHWHFLNLIRGSKLDEGRVRKNELWPFLFYESDPNTGRKTRAFWPLAGGFDGFFGREHVNFALWPLYIRTEKRGEVRYSTPWPFVQTLTGEAHGFGLWPMAGSFTRPDVYEKRYALWPFMYDNKDLRPDRDGLHQLGVLPFYTQETADGLFSQTFAWPFFGHTQESDPRPDYKEVRYFWPFFVQGRGEEQYKNRWMPFYSNQSEREREKWWFLWPILRYEKIDLNFLTRHRTQVLYFIYRGEKQSNDAGFVARKQHLWPLFSHWNDGQGHVQIQGLDLFTIFFPNNEKIQANWTPLTTIYRYDRQGEDKRHSFLWNLLVLESDGEGRERCQFGPFYQHTRMSEDNVRWKFLRGLISFESEAPRAWSFFWQSQGSKQP